MTAVAWAVIFYAVATTHPNVPMFLFSLAMVSVCTFVEWHKP